MINPVTQVQLALEASYRVERELGAGGMATVYLAHDLKHDRPVAIKVLRPELAAILGGERFLKEIRLTANLQHPHILPLHDSGQADNLVYYVMPYIEGESLRDRLQREKQLPVDEAVRIAREVADALDYAHRHHVVHRDIKPENILLHDGRALVADFGIALAVSTTGGTRMTETGMSLGTPHYMSPEQAMGEREITLKSDVYALGCVLYEMLLGEPPFTGPTAQAVVAKVMTEEPRPITLHRRTVPPHLEAAVLRALSKLPADRFATAAAFSEALAATTVTATTPVPAGRSLPALRLPRIRPWPALAGVALLAAGLTGGRMLWRERPGSDVVRFSVITGSDHRLTGAPLGVVTLSPDGRALVYVGENSRGTQLFMRRMDQLVATPIPGTEGATSPGISPDGQWVMFYAGAGARKVSLAGGSPVPVAGTNQVLFGSVWLDDLHYAVGLQDGSLAILSEDGTARTVVGTDSSSTWAVIPFAVLPNGRILAVKAQGGVLTGAAVSVDATSGAMTTILPANVAAVGFDRGVLAWLTAEGTLFGATFDPGSGRITGGAVTLAQNVRVAVGGAPGLAFSASGSLVYVPQLPFDLTVVDRTGRSRVITDVQHRFHSPRVSPDGRRIALDFTLGGSRDVWLLDRQQGTLTRVSFENDGHDPVWLPSGRRIGYAASRGGTIGMFLRDPDGAGSAESLLVRPPQITLSDVTPDGRLALAHTNGADGSWDIVAVPLIGDRTPQAVMTTSFNEFYARLSPDGRWLAYVSDESGRNEVYVRPYPGPGSRVVVSQTGGSEPVWSRSGRELFFRGFGDRGSPLIAAAIQTSPELRVTSRTTLFDVADYEAAAPHANYDVMPGDREFVMVRQGRLSEMVVIQNWPEEVLRRGTAR